MKVLRSQFRTFIAAYAWWRDRLTLSGKAVTFALAYCLPALAELDHGLLLLFLALATLLGVAGAFNFLFRPLLGVHVAAAAEARCGEPLEIVIELTNLAPRSAFDLEVRLVDRSDVWQVIRAPCAPHCLDIGGKARLTATLKPLRRGLHPLPDVAATSTFPLGLFRAGSRLCVGRRMTVLPAYRFLSAGELSQLMDGAAGDRLLRANSLGASSDYLGSREYVPGLPVRRWDYASWARLGRPVVREFSESQRSGAAIVVDTFFPAQQGDAGREIPKLEATLSLVAALSEALVRHGNRLELLAVDGSVLRLADLGSLGQLEVVLHTLALAEATPLAELPQLASELTRQPLPSLVYMVLHSWDPPRQELCDVLRAVGYHVRPLLVAAEPGNETVATLQPIGEVVVL